MAVDEFGIITLDDNLACKMMMFFRVFGYYLSSFILVVISIDRMLAVLQPVAHRYKFFKSS